MIDECLPFMEAGDIIIDGGNSLYSDTQRRCDMLAKKEIRYIGTGISGGEEGGAPRPSIMPGRQSRSMAARKGYLSGHCSES